MMSEDKDTREYTVLVNAEEQYSLWLADRPAPNGWTDTSHRGGKEDCLAYIKSVWTDMRPLSLRQKMSAASGTEPDMPASAHQSASGTTR